MNPKEQAETLIKKFSRHVYPYSGSGMLTNTVDPQVILSNAKECALVTVNLVLAAIDDDTQITFWNKVKTELSKITELPKQ